MTTPKKILDRYDARPLKRYGQSFLVDKNIMSRIVESADIGPGDRVVEIGPGVGLMTGILADRVKEVIAVEIDRRMVEILQDEMAGRTNVTIVNRDILAYDFSAAVSSSGEKVHVVGNIPYNISSQILFRMIDFRRYIEAAVLMFQRELAERILAGPGSPRYGSISVMTAMYLDSDRVINVSPRCFFPKPKVESIVLKLTAREGPIFEVKDEDVFKKVVRAGFSKRRKTLFNSLASNPFIELERERIADALEKAKIDPGRRAETLSVKEFALLSNAL